MLVNSRRKGDRRRFRNLRKYLSPLVTRQSRQFLETGGKIHFSENEVDIAISPLDDALTDWFHFSFCSKVMIDNILIKNKKRGAGEWRHCPNVLITDGRKSKEKRKISSRLLWVGKEGIERGCLLAPLMPCVKTHYNRARRKEEEDDRENVCPCPSKNSAEPAGKKKGGGGSG